MTLDNINREAVDRIIRVDHAGEYGANRIYAGQMAILGRTSVGPVIQVGTSWSLSNESHWVMHCQGRYCCPQEKENWLWGGGGGGVKSILFFL